MNASNGLGLGVLLSLILFGAAVYVFICYCYRQICVKAGHEPGVLIWIPIIQMVPVLQAAKLPVWMIVLLFVPLVNIATVVYLFWKLCEARGKAGPLGLLILVPLANLGLILYLAFAD